MITRHFYNYGKRKLNDVLLLSDIVVTSSEIHVIFRVTFFEFSFADRNRRKGQTQAIDETNPSNSNNNQQTKQLKNLEKSHKSRWHEKTRKRVEHQPKALIPKLIRGFLVPATTTDLDVYSTHESKKDSNKCGNNEKKREKGIGYQNLR